MAPRAQQGAMPVVGVLDAAAMGERTLMVGAFRQGLAEAGFVEGRNERGIAGDAPSCRSRGEIG